MLLVPSKFDELQECWFPEDGISPSAFLVDTSEEALLLPDWLKLRMIRSTNSRLVDAALRVTKIVFISQNIDVQNILLTTKFVIEFV